MAWKLREMCVMHEKSMDAASSPRQGAATTMWSTTPGAAACSAASGADSSPEEDHKIRLTEGNKDFDTYHLLRWPVLRLYVLLDSAGAALDASRLPTFANTGD